MIRLGGRRTVRSDHSLQLSSCSIPLRSPSHLDHAEAKHDINTSDRLLVWSRHLHHFSPSKRNDLNGLDTVMGTSDNQWSVENVRNGIHGNDERFR